MNFITHNSKQTQKIAETLAKEIAAAEPFVKTAFIIALIGDLGSGKTTFTQGFVKGFGIKEKITSPTFVLMRRHRVRIKNHESRIMGRKSGNGNYRNLYHLDCYRLESAEELSALEFKDIITNPENIVLIEWADKIKKVLPKTALKIKFEWVDKNKRKITIRS